MTLLHAAFGWQTADGFLVCHGKIEIGLQAQPIERGGQEAYVPHFTAPKISYPHFNAARHFFFEPNGAFSNNKSYLVPSDDLALLSLLNSRMIWFLLSSMSPPVRGGYRELRVQYVETMPIPAWGDADKAKLEALAQSAQTHAEARYTLQEGVRRRIPDLRPTDSMAALNTKLKEWWTLPDFTAFRAEVKKAFKADIPLSERSDWEDWVDRDRAEIAQLEAKIDGIVYELFDLTPDEIALLEASI